MNQNTNKLPRRAISNNKNLGKVDNSKVNFELTGNPNIPLTDGCGTYYNSKFQFTDFFNKDIQPHSWINKPKFLLKEKGGKLYRTDQTGLELAFLHLCSLYQDLDTCLQRLYDGYHDSMFVRFALKMGIFTTKEHWQFLLRNYDEAFPLAIANYHQYAHSLYEPGSNLSYVTFFDTHFPYYLYYALLTNETSVNGKDVNWLNKEKEVVRLSQLDDQDISITYRPDVYSSWLMCPKF